MQRAHLGLLWEWGGTVVAALHGCHPDTGHIDSRGSLGYGVDRPQG